MLATRGAVELVSEGPRTGVAYRLDTTPKILIPDAVWAAGVRFVINHLLKRAVNETERRAGSKGSVG
jgi:hypothetical protein